ncbi:MAG: DUF1800 family protein, partial [Pseudomonadota bacterium]
PSHPPASPPAPPPPPPPDLPVMEELTDADAFRFMQQATFGASSDDLDDLMQKGINTWLVEQLIEPTVDYTPRIQEQSASRNVNAQDIKTLFWERAVYGDDQLRQRIAYALSQIVVTSLADAAVGTYPAPFGVYADVLQRNALGNYCTMVREVSFNPIMGLYLTHLGNRREDPVNGFVPDENYAREVMQLFTIGLEELNLDGTPTGEETYTNEDIAGLAQVFTGLSWADTDFDRPRISDNNRFLPMESFRAQHEDRPKTFLGSTINLGDDAVVSINAALDVLLEHPNVAPFISKQLIQKLVTSNPSPEYVERVATAFNAGQTYLSDGTLIGSGQRCDLAATAAAILIDPEARGEPEDDDFGKLRSPLLRAAHLLRAYRVEKDVSTSGPLPSGRNLVNLEEENRLLQNVFTAPSVFNYYRPGFVAPGTESADRGLVTPEFQLATTSGLVAYINTMEFLIEEKGAAPDGNVMVAELDYSDLEALADQPAALVDRVDQVLVGGTLPDDTKALIAEAVDEIFINPSNEQVGRGLRTQVALLMAVVSPEYVVQR